MWPSAKTIFLILAAYAGAGDAAAIQERQSGCPGIHVFGARETTVSPGYGSSGAFINDIKSAYPGTTSEAISYPACGGQSSCGGVQYGDSAREGTSNVATAVNNFHSRCPNTKMVLVGYSQGGQIMDNAFCGGPDYGAGIWDSNIPIASSAQSMIKAAVLLGSPRYQYGVSYSAGTCRAGGFAARPSGFWCANASKMKSYSDWQDPYACNGSDGAHHQAYHSIYGSDALNFVKSKL